MKFLHPLRPLNQLTRIGLLLLILASGTKYLVARQLVPVTDFTDFILGLLYGLSIGALLLGIRRDSHDRRVESSSLD